MHDPVEPEMQSTLLPTQVVLEVETAGEEGSNRELDTVHGILRQAGFDDVHTDEPLKGSRVYQVYAKRNAGGLGPEESQRQT